MAKEEIQEEPKKKKNIVKILVISLISGLVLTGAGIGGILYMKKQDKIAQEKAEEEELVVAVKKEYYTMERFVTNLRAIAEDGTNLDKFISMELSLEINDDEKKEEKKLFIKTYSPMIKNTLLLTIDKFDDKQLLMAEGKQRLANTLKEDLNELYKEQQKAAGKNKVGNLVENILFTSFIIQ